jgi:hypothetical protein
MATGRVPTTANSPLTAKGDLFTYSTAPARLAVGLDGEQIVADSATSTGLRYQTGYNGNAIINGGYDVWQRGTSIAYTAANTFFADRWSGYRGGLATGATVSRQVTGDTTNLPNIQYCMRVQRDSGNTSVENLNFWYNLETTDSIRFVGQPVTVSFYARKGATYSPTSSNFTFRLISGTGTDQSIASGYTGQATAATTGLVPLTTTWQRFQITTTVTSSVTQLGLMGLFTPVGTAGATDYMEITGVQLELGSIATAFKRSNGSGGTIQGELAACQRYYVRSTGTGFMEHGGGTAWSTTRNYSSVQLPVTMRVAPTSIDYSTLALYNPAAASYAVTNLTINYAGTQRTNLDTTIGTASLTGNVFYTLTNNNSANGYLGFNAEL